MKFVLELVLEPTGYNIRRTELEKHPEIGHMFVDTSLCFKDSIQNYLIVEDLMQGIEKTLGNKMFQLLAKTKTSKAYKLTYETLPIWR